MAHDKAAVLLKVKTKLDIASSNTDFDTILNDSIEQAVPRLAPYSQNALAADESVTLAAGVDSFTLPVAGSDLKRLFTRRSTTEVWSEYDLWSRFKDTIYLEQPINIATSVKILAESNWTWSDTDLDTMPTSLRLPLYLFAMCEFATYLAGNKRKFNIYQQLNGSRSLEEMQDLATFYENRAIAILENEVSAEGY